VINPKPQAPPTECPSEDEEMESMERGILNWVLLIQEGIKTDAEKVECSESDLPSNEVILRLGSGPNLTEDVNSAESAMPFD